MPIAVSTVMVQGYPGVRRLVDERAVAAAHGFVCRHETNATMPLCSSAFQRLQQTGVNFFDVGAKGPQRPSELCKCW